MARSISIDALGFHNLSRGVDSIRVKYDDSKSDKAGEKCTQKNCYGNPFDGNICFFLAMGCYCALQPE